MKKNLLSMVKWQLLVVIFMFTNKITFTQNPVLEKRADSLERYGAIGLRPGVLCNLNKNNQFSIPLLSFFVDFNAGRFQHSIELDFLTRWPHRIFRSVNSPCLSYDFSVKTATWNKLNLNAGIFLNCRKDVLSRIQYFHPKDTSVAERGFHTILSLGPSVEISRKIFCFKNSSFLILGARIAYSFDIFGYGSTVVSSQTYIEDDAFRKLKPAERFQRDTFVFTLKIGWGKLLEKREKTPDFELD